MSCRVALKRLERRGHLRLPAPRRKPVPRTPRPGPAVPVDFQPVVASLAEVGPVEIVRVTDRRSEHARIWNAMMDRDHPLGRGPLCGAQLRYLVRSPSHGWLGALAFSGAAWRLEARDRWIGWSEGARRANLHRVVANSRFLIRPDVRVPHLASHVLARCVRRLRADWQAVYGYAPELVETFVETDRFSATSYRAANWLWVGRTRGRGRQDRRHRGLLSVKDVYVYPLHRKARQRLCEGGCELAQPAASEKASAWASASTSATASAPTPEPGDWAEEEFGRAELGDARLHKRLLCVARDFFARPQAQVPQACGSRAKTKAAYRFFDHPRATMDILLGSHIKATWARMRQHRVVLAVQDTTTLNHTAHPSTEGLGPLHTADDITQGLLLHDTVAFTEDGVPLGLLDVQCWARDGQGAGTKGTSKNRPIEQKESAKWLRSYRAAAEARKHCPDTRVVSVGDREADLYELFAEAVSTTGGPDLLVRAERTRSRNTEHGPLWDHMARQPVAGFVDIHVPRRGRRPARTARLAVRCARVELQPPRGKKALGPVPIWAVYAHEVDYEPTVVKTPICWMLLTTVATDGLEQALRRLQWYTQRWGIEVYHRTLKSGCRIENRQLGTAKRLETCLAIDMVVAWRVHHLVHLGRKAPEIPCTAYFEEAQWKALVAFVTQDPTPRSDPRRCARPPGWWRAWAGSWGANPTATRAPRRSGLGSSASTTSRPCGAS